MTARIELASSHPDGTPVGLLVNGSLDDVHRALRLADGFVQLVRDDGEPFVVNTARVETVWAA